jgi:hypothetical protein
MHHVIVGNGVCGMSRRSLSFVLDRLAEAQFDEELSPRWRRQPGAPPT